MNTLWQFMRINGIGCVNSALMGQRAKCSLTTTWLPNIKLSPLKNTNVICVGKFARAQYHWGNTRSLGCAHYTNNSNVTFCKQFYKTTTGLHLHKQAEHVNKESRPVCAKCGKTFSSEGNLKTHMDCHSAQDMLAKPKRKPKEKSPNRGKMVYNCHVLVYF